MNIIEKFLPLLSLIGSALHPYFTRIRLVSRSVPFVELSEDRILVGFNWIFDESARARTGAELIEKTKRILIVFLFLLVIIVSIQLYYISKKPSVVWITADRYIIGPSEPVNVSLAEIMEFPALLNALENTEKYGHYTDAFSLNSSDADKLLDLIKSKSGHVIKQHVRNQNYVVYRFLIRIIDKQQTYGVSISYREKKPLIL